MRANVDLAALPVKPPGPGCRNRGCALLAAVLLSGCGGSSSAKKSDGGGGAGGGGGASAGGTGGIAISTGGSGGARDGGPPGDAGGGEVTAAAANLAKACNADIDCGAGLICLKATDTKLARTGGPAHGYCTIACTQDADCRPLGGVCFDYRLSASDPAASYCLETCTFGPGPAGSDPIAVRAAKCQGRPDVGCLTVDATNALAACLPMCSQDIDCPTGRKCDPRYNVCVDTPSTGDRMGLHCTVNADAGTSTCAGECLQIGASAAALVASVCSTQCVSGELGACNWVDQSMSVAGGTHGVCGLRSASAGDGDVGFCTVECDTASDCPDTVDRTTCDTSQVAVIGHGACVWNGGAGPDAGTDGSRG